MKKQEAERSVSFSGKLFHRTEAGRVFTQKLKKLLKLLLFVNVIFKSICIFQAFALKTTGDNDMVKNKFWFSAYPLS